MHISITIFNSNIVNFMYFHNIQALYQWRAQKKKKNSLVSSSHGKFVFLFGFNGPLAF